jgi:hypothetical protein
MFYVVAILIAGLWAAFLLPSFFDHRSHAPRTTTRDFARTKRLLERVSSADPDGEDYVRHHAQIRRRNILIGLAMTAAVTLGIATWMGSVAWLWLTIAIDVVVAAYITQLLIMKQQRSAPRAAVVRLGGQKKQAATNQDASKPAYEETPTVRVIAG